jgi:hypothetical protein
MDSGRPGVFADAGEVALAFAGANNAANPVVNFVTVSDVNPQGAHYAAPSALVMAAASFTPRKSGVCILGFSFAYATSGAGTVGILIQENLGATVSGGTPVTGWNIDEGSTVTIAGGAGNSTFATLAKTAAGAVSADAAWTLVQGGFAIGTPIVVSLVVTTAVTLSTMNLCAFIVELT